MIKFKKIKNKNSWRLFDNNGKAVENFTPSTKKIIEFLKMEKLLNSGRQFSIELGAWNPFIDKAIKNYINNKIMGINEALAFFQLYLNNRNGTFSFEDFNKMIFASELDL